MLRMLLSPRWLVRHLLLAVAIATCVLFGRWQLGRALERDSILNWSYTVEWFLFGGFALLTWGWFLRDERDELRGEPSGAVAEQEAPAVPSYQPVAQQVSDDEDPELAAYNRYLAELESKSKR